MVGARGPRVSRLARSAARTRLYDLDGSEHVPSDVRIRRSSRNVGTDETTDEEASVAELTNASKVVFSSTLQPPLSWPNTRLISGDAVEAVREMKREGNSPMRTLGSLTLCRSLLKAGLVDRFRVVVFPVITGSTGYDRIYDGYPDVALDMVASRTFDGRIQLLEYVPRVLTGPPDGPTVTEISRPSAGRSFTNCPFTPTLPAISSALRPRARGLRLAYGQRRLRLRRAPRTLGSLYADSRTHATSKKPQLTVLVSNTGICVPAGIEPEHRFLMGVSWCVLARRCDTTVRNAK